MPNPNLEAYRVPGQLGRSRFSMQNSFITETHIDKIHA
jgi:hypothetical protein